MSDKFFFKGRAQSKPKHVSHGYSSKRQLRPGTIESPLSLSVTTQERKNVIEAMLSEHALHARITINPDVPENIRELDSLLNTTKTIHVEKTPNRNDTCPCGSGKKYKKCCAQ